MTFVYNGSDTFQDDINCRSQTDSVLGGLDEPANQASQDLADCAVYLKAQDFRDLQAQIEAASGGTATARQDAGDLIDYFHVIEKFRPNQVDSNMGLYTGVWSPVRLYHPAFYVNGVLQEKLLFGIYTGIQQTVGSTNYLAQAVDADPLSATYSITTLRTICENKGTGYHLMNYLEYAAAALLSLERTAQIYGNDNYGSTAAGTTNDTPRGRRWTASNDLGQTVPGSGPPSWRHNLEKPWGIADIIGNAGQVLDGIYVSSGQIYTFSTRDNYFTQSEGSYTSTNMYYDLDGGSTPHLNTSVSGSGLAPASSDFENTYVSAALKAAGNTLVDSSYITDTMLCNEWNKSAVLTTPALFGTLQLGDIDIQTLAAKVYLVAGGSYDGTSGYGIAGLGNRYFEATSSALTGRCCLID